MRTIPYLLVLNPRNILIGRYHATQEQAPASNLSFRMQSQDLRAFSESWPAYELPICTQLCTQALELLDIEV